MLLNSILVEADAELVAGIKDTNQEFFGKLYDKYAASLMGVISRITNDNKKAEEILNATFVAAWQQKLQLNDLKSTIFTWLVNITRKTALNQLKNGDLQTQTPLTFVNKDNTNEFDKKSVTQIEKASFELVYFKGLSRIEAAELLNITVVDLMVNIRNIVQNMKVKK